MGANRWRGESEWPLARASQTEFYLRSKGNANTAGGDGVLSREPPTDEPHDGYVYDPRDPVMTRYSLSGQQEPWDQSPLDWRKDILIYSTPPLERAVEAGRLAAKPVIVDMRILTEYDRTTRKILLDIMRPGDMHTHSYSDHQVEILNRATRKVQPYMWEARKRGVLFDIGHGNGSFIFPVAADAIKEGFPPDTISTDLHNSSIFTTKPDMPNVISKLLNLGMDLKDAIYRSTVRPAQAIDKFPEAGTLGEGRTADIAVFKLSRGVFGFTDSKRRRLLGTRRLEAVLTVRNGKLVFDANGLAFPDWRTAGDYTRIP
jgi:predicted amidohydrolase